MLIFTLLRIGEVLDVVCYVLWKVYTFDTLQLEVSFRQPEDFNFLTYFNGLFKQKKKKFQLSYFMFKCLF